MKKLLALMMAVLLLPVFAVAEEEEAIPNGTPVTLTIGELVIPAVLNDTMAAQDLISRLPYTVTVNRGSVDFCGDMGEPLQYEDGDFQRGLQYGDLAWMPNGNWFVFFTDDIESRMDRDWLVLGHMDDSWEQVKDLQGSIEITIELTEETALNRKIDIEVNGQVRTATLNDNRSAEALVELLRQGPLTVNMSDYGSFEKVGPLGTDLPRSDESITTTPGDIILYQGNSITIYYAVNSWNFTLLGHIDDATGENMRAFLGDGNPTVTFSLHTDDE